MAQSCLVYSPHPAVSEHPGLCDSYNGRREQKELLYACIADAPVQVSHGTRWEDLSCYFLENLALDVCWRWMHLGLQLWTRYDYENTYALSDFSDQPVALVSHELQRHMHLARDFLGA